jgi:ribonuclease HI
MLLTRLEHWLDKDWTHLVTEAARLFWTVRVAEARAEDPPPSSDPLHIVLARWRRRLGTLRLWAGSPDSVELDRHIIRALSSGFADPTDRIPLIRLTTGCFLLFFDDGSRGNPGPGGSGAVIVRARDDFEILWMASMSFARRTTTKNYEEFQGLCTVLHAAVRHQWHPLTVIGDSAMILSLMRRHKSPNVHSLRPLYTQARRAAAAIRVTGWHHHYRAQNKMANKAANIAMDARRSVQALAQDAREELTALTPFLANDCEPWAKRLLLSSRSPDRTAAPGD